MKILFVWLFILSLYLPQATAKPPLIRIRSLLDPLQQLFRGISLRIKGRNSSQFNLFKQMGMKRQASRFGSWLSAMKTHPSAEHLISAQESVTEAISHYKDVFDSYPGPIRWCITASAILYLAWNANNRQISSTLMNHFADSDENTSKLRWWTWLTSSFSHINILHLIGNLTALCSLGPVVCEAIGDSDFVVLVAVAALFSSWSSWLGRRISHFMRNPLSSSSFPFYRHSNRNIHSSSYSAPSPPPNSSSYYSIGFSGVNAAILVLYVALRPYSEISVLGVMAPMEAKDALVVFMAMDVVGVLLGYVGIYSEVVNHAAHLGGYAAGFLMYSILENRMMAERRIFGFGKSFLKSWL